MTAGSPWLVQRTADASHVIPIDDLREHIASLSCWCGPTDDEGVIVHHSLDRREEYEEGRRPI